MTSDKELLELAAKAAELPERGWMGPAFMYVKDNTFTEWNPLTDDGDALRLVVKLGIDLQIGNGISAAQAPSHDELQCYFYCSEVHNGDPYAATRLAIVRAASQLGTSEEIGKAMV